MEAGKTAAIDDSSPLELADAKRESADIAGVEKAAKTLPWLPEQEIMLILLMKSEPCESDSPLDKQLNADYEEFREHVRQEYMSKGYVEVEEDYFEVRKAKEAWLKEEWKKMDFSGFPTADYMSDEYRDCVVFPWDD